jgi:hypothetical protein
MLSKGATREAVMAYYHGPAGGYSAPSVPVGKRRPPMLTRGATRAEVEAFYRS